MKNLDDLVYEIEKKKALNIQGVVKCNCKTPRPQIKVSENGIRGYCANCAEPL